MEAFCSVCRKTSPSPSGIHYTFWKSTVSDRKMSSYLVIMMCLPFMYGFMNGRWTKCLDVMLEKKPSVWIIHQLWITGLVKADFNTALKLYFTKHLVANSERTELTEEQWGGRPGRTFTEPALRKLLAFGYGRVMYVRIALFVNDATACFDRMVPDISSLVSMKYSMGKSVMKYRNEIMAKMEHGVRTKHGESTSAYRQLPGEQQLAGEMQGKGDVASLWSILSHTLLLQHLEKGAQYWADLIQASGGSIALHKCIWQILCLSSHTFPPKLEDLSSHEIWLSDGRGATMKITQNNRSTPNKDLGCRLAPDGNNAPTHS
ncbi:hypothetical protein ACHAWF_011877 [Thalassiosira exigua]